MKRYVRSSGRAGWYCLLLAGCCLGGRGLEVNAAASLDSLALDDDEESLEQRLGSLQATKKTLEDEKAGLASEVNRLKKKLSVIEEEVEQETKAVVQKEKENNQLQEKLRSLGVEIQKAAERTLAQKETLQVLSKEETDLSKKIEERTAVSAKLVSANQQNREKLQKEKKNLESLQQKRDAAQKAYEETAETISKVEDLKTRAETKLATVEDQIDAVTIELEAIKNKIETLEFRHAPHPFDTPSSPAPWNRRMQTMGSEELAGTLADQGVSQAGGTRMSQSGSSDRTLLTRRLSGQSDLSEAASFYHGQGEAEDDGNSDPGNGGSRSARTSIDLSRPISPVVRGRINRLGSESRRDLAPFRPEERGEDVGENSSNKASAQPSRSIIFLIGIGIGMVCMALYYYVAGRLRRGEAEHPPARKVRPSRKKREPVWSKWAKQLPLPVRKMFGG